MAVKFKLLGIPVGIGFDFFLVMLVLGALWRTPDQLPAWMIIATGSVLIHEMGHAAVSEFLGFRPVIRLYGGGGLTLTMSTPGRQIAPREHIAIAAAGPLAGLILGGGVALAVLASPHISTSDIVEDLLWVSLGWSVVNLIPLPGVDGGSIVSELTTIVLGRPSEAVGRGVGIAVVVVILAGMLAAGLYDWAFIIGFFAVFNMMRMGFGQSAVGGRPPAQSAQQLMADGRYQDAFNLARLGMQDQPNDIGPLLIASDALRLMSRYADAMWGYDKVLGVDAANQRALRGRAFALRHLGRDAEAEADLRTLLAMNPDVAAITQASALYDANRHEDGYRLVSGFVPTGQSPALVRVVKTFLTMFGYVLGREQEALRHVEELLAATPDDSGLLEQRALILIDMGRFPEAISDARKALGMKPQQPSYLETLGIGARMSGDAGAALQALVLSTETRPSDPRARSELALCHLQLGKVGEAKAAIETLPGYALRDPFAQYAQAALAVAGGDSGAAIGFLREARRLRPELGLRAGFDPLFRSLLADPATRSALASTSG